ncbi:MAG: hypothetical protein UT13_C0001G0647 [Candidatus Pacebacteria bacterium GW2011_GWF2_38_9]|nr:MAG: hypothetical protein US01_C0001G0676 [candidate division TM6 bacterium GW2011_GWF2_28_16]KKQ08670.1 MAG: hypothetical protein US20_C0013G0020 [Candidatus Pacebacteria bacterium GW2011_GWF1_36_5]KKQ89000.1 MAG: hypothetical protein UT13_C0001G0647 [Candidatus Pacebacteria bacterium GW2011_GWF2_38_9]
MNFYLIIFTIFVSSVFALLEIQIEGENGWAKNLPTWKRPNPFKKIINWPYITGYHLFLNLFLFSVFQFPFFIGLDLNLNNELLVAEVLLTIFILEDFLWFAFNPKWGVNRFFKKEIPWHANKILYLPKNYWVGLIVLIGLDLLRKFLLH